MNFFKKIAAFLALFIGVMSVFSGSKVLLGIDTKEYNILIWLVYYNVIYGIFSIFAAFLIWRSNEKSKVLTLFILASHFIVFVFLKFFSSTAASESIGAMTFRIGIWSLIVVLSLIIPKYFNKNKK
jgi:lysylphosphatidylglycerol synthetase-like protein (DUF2156 family)